MTPARVFDLPSAGDRLAAIEALDDVIICTDTELRITAWNVAAERQLDRPATDAVGKPLMQLVSPECRIDEGQYLQAVLRADAVPRHDTVFLRPDGVAVPLSVAVGPIRDGAGRVTGVAMLGHDVAMQQRLAMQLLHSKRTESTGHLAGGVAHEFNNILTAILALADFIVKEVPTNHPSREDLEEIRHQAANGARLVRHLLAFSRRQLLRTEVVHLGTIFQEIEPLLQRLVSERVLFATDVAFDTRPVEIDRGQFELVLLELVSNAADAMPSGGTLTVTVRSLTIREHEASIGVKAGDYVQITLQDTGAGFDPAIQGRLLEPFFTTKGEGHTGLGLAMVDGVIHQHGGAVKIDSEPGEGTIVRVLLPASGKSAPADRQPGATGTGGHGGDETILVVEDETAVRQIICRSLRDRGYDILEAKNGEDALLVAEKHNAPIHLVITDVVMPEMGGAELFAHLRRWYPTMRILFISGYTKGSIPPEALEEGAGAAFLPKPFTLEQLGAEVRRVIEGPRPQVASFKA